ncbi:P-loop containing nucleoside triphosphate hydrolase protein [Schizophyllum amplum]|uniref:RNA helicase n=1 Tax=Schizophyllum amplum TaxID=97359 RepID=A0A550CLT8_9AGAR|nr:P-loop containing nucleoside triphosphate hydrolase protein [Auriculariopsis ampla]
MAKKKKTALKPVARGFATTSVPKKVVPVEPVEEPAPTETSPEEESQEAPYVEGDAAGDANKAADSGLSDEEQVLQALVDKLQDKVEKEVTRTVKAIEVDRRFAQTLPVLELDSIATKRVLDLALNSDVRLDGKKSVDDADDKSVTKLGITYGVLRRLGFSEARVDECLRNMNGLDIEEAYDWLYLHCDEAELQFNKEAPDAPEPKTPGSQAKGTPRTPRTPAQFLALSTPTPKSVKASAKASSGKPRLDAQAPAFVPRSLSTTPSAPGTPAAEEDEPDLSKPRTPAPKNGLQQMDDKFALSTQDLSSSDEPHDDYVKIKLHMDEINAQKLKGNPVGMAKLPTLRKQLEDVKQNYFFDFREAEEMYSVARSKADAEALQAKLRGLDAQDGPITTPVKRPKADKKKPPPNISIKSEPGSTVATDDGSESEEGGMFALLEGAPTSGTNSEGKTIPVRDMALPKHWSGRTPKTLLSEAVSKIDRYAAISYSNVSGSSRAMRTRLNIRWEGGRTDEWAMEDVACSEMGQAEQYISLVGLHALSFPATEGFAAGAISSAVGSQTFFRLLPPNFRDLWDELDAARKKREDASNRETWRKLRSILDEKAQRSGKVLKAAKSAPDVKEAPISDAPTQNGEAFSEQLMEAFLARQASLSYQEMLGYRDQLPIAAYRQEIINILDASQVLVLSGETGCGKSTQVPTFILEDQLSRGKPCKIFCTEPRRISAISLAQRVSRELGDATNAVGTNASLVGYSIRLESNTSKNTRLTFVTNGIALRMLENGSGQSGHGTAFDEITHIIIDEVHERTIESDFLLLTLRQLLAQRSDLKVILMSATVDAEKISEYFGGCPTLQVPGRTFPVDVQFLEDAVECTRWKVDEKSPYARRKHDKFNNGKNKIDWSEELGTRDEDEDESDATDDSKARLGKRYSPSTADTINLYDDRLIPYDLIVRLLERICFEDPAMMNYSAAILIFMPGINEIRRLNEMLTEHRAFGGDQFILYPLHSTLSSEAQGSVFNLPPPGIRKIVIATNIAETGITIPDITCVIDTGKHREMRFDEKRQISRLVETFIAKSNAAQRRGRAGRVQSGLCFHLFTKFRHDKMADHPLPEMMRLSLSDLALRIKIMKVKLGNSIEEVLLQALDPPQSVNIQRAVSMLVEVRALTPTEDITPMGRLLSQLPTDVHLGKFLLMAALFRCLDPALTIAATLNSKSPFLSPFGMEQEADRAKASFRMENSDFSTIHNAFATWRRVVTNPSNNASFVKRFCRDAFLSHQNLQQIEDLRQQFLGYLVDSSFIHVDRAFIRELQRSRYTRNRTKFVSVPSEFDVNSENTFLVNAALAAGLYPKLLSVDRGGTMRTISNNQAASFHPSSVNFKRRPLSFGVNHLAYFTLMHSKKLYVWETSPVDDMAIALLCGDHDFKLTANSFFIDRKIRFCVEPKVNMAIKVLRSQLASNLSQQLRGKRLVGTQVQWQELAMMVLGKTKFEDEDGQKSIMLST